MKKLLLIYCFIFGSTSAFPELPIHNPEFDTDGIQKIGSWKQVSQNFLPPLFLQKNMLVSVSFDSLRPIYEVNDTAAADAFPWISANGRRLYYTHANLGNGLFFSERIAVNLPWTVPVNLNVTGTGFSLSRNELELYACDGSDVFHYERTNFLSPFTNQQPMILNFPQAPSFYRSLSFDSSGTQMFLYAFFPGMVKLCEMTKVTQFEYDFVREIPIPAGFSSTNGQVSVDGLSFYLSMKDVSGFSNIARMERASLADTFNASTAQFIPEFFDSTYFSIHPSTSQNEEWLVFAKSPTDSWSQTNLFIASKTGVLSSVFDNMEMYTRAYPNPVTDLLHIVSNKSGNLPAELKIYSPDGKLCHAEKFSDAGKIEVNLSDLHTGVYFYSLNSGKDFFQGKFIIQK